jgi:hypothetical protein
LGKKSRSPHGERGLKSSKVLTPSLIIAIINTSDICCVTHLLYIVYHMALDLLSIFQKYF